MVAAGARGRLPAVVLAVGLVSFFTDLASELIVPLLPALYARIGADAAALGLLIGTSDLAVAALKLASGALSDRQRRRRPWIVGGYLISTLARPLFAVVALAWQALLVRVLDRVGKGLRSAPRDALLAAAVAPDQRGRAFGLQRALDHAGALAGALVGYGLLRAGVELRTVFALTLVPGLAAVAIAWVGVREVEDAPPAPAAAPAVPDPSIAPRRPAPGALRRLAPALPLVACTAVAASVDLFALVRAGELGHPVAHLPLLWVALHTTRAALAGRCGTLSDRLGRRGVLAAGLLVHALVLAAFAVVREARLLWLLFPLLGLHAGLTDGAERGLVADLTGATKRGTAFGIYHAAQGLAAFAGPVAIGLSWRHHGAGAGFAVAATAALLGAVAALLLRPSPPS